MTTAITTTSDRPERPDPSTIYKHRLDLIRSARELWASRGLVWSLAERQIRARYKQALLGFAWAAISPILLLVAIVVFVDNVADVDTEGVPTALFTYVGLIPWTLFSTSMNQAATSILSNLGLINKIPCPREVFPLAAVSMACFDITLSIIAVALLFGIEGFAPGIEALWFPVIAAVLMVFVTGFAILISVVTVYFRDVRNALPMVVQLGLFVTPVAFPLTDIPESIRPWYCLYPVAPVIDSFRQTLLYGSAPRWGLLGMGVIGAFGTFIAGYWLFKKMEVRIADVA